MKRIGLYIHIPFCVRKCLYCDFLSGVYDDNTIRRYIDTLKKEIVMYSDINMIIDTIYIGGGTPSLIDSNLIAEVIDTVRDNFVVDDNAEITLEMNPGTIDEGKLRCYKVAGINRISIGLQSANDEELKTLGRIHSYKEFLNAYDMVRRTGFDNVNVDIISAVPGQSIESYQHTLSEVVKLSPEHISSYSLIIEENTPFYNMYSKSSGSRYKDIKPLPCEEDERAMYSMTKHFLGEMGYKKYEISNYCKEGYESRHNSSYWKGTWYIGVGAGASSYMNMKRYNNICSVEEYIEHFPDVRENVEVIDRKAAMEEFMFLGLRMTKGVSKKEFKDRFNASMDDIYGKIIKKYIEEGLIKDEKDMVSLTDRGIDVSNSVMSEFLLD